MNIQLVFYFTQQLQIHKSEYVPIDGEKSGWKTDAGGRVITYTLALQIYIVKRIYLATIITVIIFWGV